MVIRDDSQDYSKDDTLVHTDTQSKEFDHNRALSPSKKASADKKEPTQKKQKPLRGKTLNHSHFQKQLNELCKDERKSGKNATASPSKANKNQNFTQLTRDQQNKSRASHNRYMQLPDLK